MKSKTTYEELEQRVKELEKEGIERSLAEENYRAIFESVNDAIMIHEAKTGRSLGINPKMEELLGYSEEEVKHLKVSDWTVGDPVIMQNEAMRRIKNAALGNPQLFEWHAKRKDNKQMIERLRMETENSQGMTMGKPS